MAIVKTIPLSEPYLCGNEWKYVKECLDSGWVSSVGGYVVRFEENIARYLNRRYAVAVTNGTAALHVSLLAAGVHEGDEIIVPTLTFIAPVNAIHYCGAVPVFMDCCAGTLCLDVAKVEDFLRTQCCRRRGGIYNKMTGRRVKAVIPVHIFGHPADMDRLVSVCRKYGLMVIEDATESLGATYKGRKAGALGDVACLSFNGNKIITTGGGGMVATDDAKLAARIRHLSTQAKTHPIEYDHDQVGYNYRLTNIQAAMGVAQLELLDKFVAIKRRNALLYRQLFEGLPEVSMLWEEQYVQSNFWLYALRVNRRNKQKLVEFLLRKGIGVRPIWKLIHLFPMYRHCQSYALKEAPRAYRECFNIPSSVNLDPRQIHYVVKAVKTFFGLNH